MMKKLLLILNTMLGLVLVTPSATAQYCTTSLYTSACSSGDLITSFSVGTYTNATQCSSNNFGDYTTDTISLAQLSVNNLTVVHGPSWSQGAAIWVDWNKDGDWADAGEFVWNSTGAALSHTGTMAIPAAASVDSTYRLRVRCNYNAALTSSQSCSSLTFGEAEDYTIKITPPPACPAPLFITSNSITSSSAWIHWQSNGVAFNTEYGLSGFTQGTGTTGTSLADSAQLTSLTPNTMYDVYVQNNCSSAGNGTSLWSGPHTFTTSCVAISTYPNTENFDGSAWSPTTTIDQCWSRFSSNSVQWFVSTGGTPSFSTGPTGDHTTGTTGNYMYIETSSGSAGDTAWLYTPDYDLTSLSVPLMSFYYHMHGATMGSLIVQASTNGSTWTTVSTLSGQKQLNQTDPWLEETVDLSTFKSTATKIRFAGVRGTSFTGDLSIDDVKVEEAPPCPKPTGVNFTNISSSGADMNFFSGGYAFPIEWGPTGFTQGTGTQDTAFSSPHALTGMPANSLIDVYIQNDCTDSAKGTSVWAGPFTFRTLCAPFAQGYFNNFDALTVPDMDPCWTLLTQGGTTSGAANSYAPFTWNNLQAKSSPNVMRVYNGSSTYAALVSPEFVGLDGDTSQIRFQLGYDYFNVPTNMDLIVGTLGDLNDTSSFVAVDTLTPTTNNTFEEFTVLLNNVPTGHKYVALLHSGNNQTFTYFSFDDFYYEAIPSCLPPTSVTTTSLTDVSATITWVNGGDTVQNIEYGPVGFTQGTGTVLVANGTTTTLTGLTPNTCYDYYIQTVCGVTTSPYSGPFTFCTECAAQAQGYSNNFDALVVPTLDPCWSYSTAGGTTPGNANTYAPFTWSALQPVSSPNVMRLYNGNSTYAALVSPALVGLDGDSSQIRFQMGYDYFTMPANMDLVVGTLSDPTDTSTFVAVTTLTPSANNTWDEYIVLLDNVPAGHKYVAFIHSGSNQTFTYFSFDDFNYEPIPPCPDPLNIMATNLQGFNATIGWTGHSSSNQYRVEYGTTGFIQGTGTLDSTSTTSYTVTGLTPTTCYDIYVQSDCGLTNGNSAWVGPFNFCTTVSCPAPSGIYDTLRTTTSATIKWMTGGASAWEVSWGPGGTAAGAGTISSVSTTPQLALTGLTNCTPYSVWVRDVCGANDTSVWTGPYNFTTDALPQSLPFIESFNFGLGCWTVVDGGTTNDTWNGIASYGASSLDGTPFGHVDSDAAGSGSANVLDEQLISPPIDASGTLNLPLTLEFDQYYRNLGDTSFVDVWDGTQWVNVLTQTSTQGGWSAPNHQSIVISSYANANLKVRFRYKDYGIWAWYWAVDNVNIHDVPTCPAPTSLSATNITASSADISWTSGGATNWNLQYGTSGFVPGNGTFMYNVSNPDSITGLLPNTCYDYYVQDSCGAGDVSTWTGPYTFCTACTYYTAPWSDNLDAGGWNSATGTFDQCWTSTPGVTTTPSWRVDLGGTSSSNTGPSGDHTTGTTNYVYLETSGGSQGMSGELTTPIVDISSTNLPELEFFYHMYGATMGKLVVQVNYNSTGWVDIDSIVGQQQTASTDTFYPRIVPLASGNSTVQIKFIGYRGSSFTGDMALDDIGISGVTACPVPTGLAVSNIACDTATLAWTSDPGTILTFVRYDTTGFNPATGGMLLINPTSPVTLSGLQPGTSYDVYVADSCALGISASMTSFTALAGPLPTIAVSANATSVTATNATWFFDASGTQNGSKYTWDFGNGNMGTGDTSSFVFNTNGSYSITLTVENGCGSVDSTFTINVEGISIEESALASSLNVFPNPNDGNFNVSFTLESSEKVDMRIVNAVGQVIFEKTLGKVSAFNGEIDLSNEAKGIYILQIETSKGIISKRVTLQ